MIRKRRDQVYLYEFLSNKIYQPNVFYLFQVKKELNPADVINLLNIRYRVCELHTSKQETEYSHLPIIP